jgi:hypothetical protein
MMNELNDFATKEEKRSSLKEIRPSKDYPGNVNVDDEQEKNNPKRRRKRANKTEVVVGPDGETVRVAKKKKQSTKIVF